jgi:hypothetical protein
VDAEAAGQVRTMNLRQLVDRYCALTPEFGQAVPLASFQLSQTEAEKMFSSFDEDYHISRFFKFSEADGEKYSINGLPVTHVSIDAEIATIL